jgi:hypothetical protein
MTDVDVYVQMGYVYLAVEYADGTRRPLRAQEGVLLVVQPGYEDDLLVTRLDPSVLNADYSLTVVAGAASLPDFNDAVKVCAAHL